MWYLLRPVRLLSCTILTAVLFLGCSHEEETLQVPEEGTVQLSRASNGEVSRFVYLNKSQQIDFRVEITSSALDRVVLVKSHDGKILCRTVFGKGKVGGSTSPQIAFDRSWETTPGGTQSVCTWLHRDGYLVFKEETWLDKDGSATMKKQYGPFGLELYSSTNAVTRPKD